MKLDLEKLKKLVNEACDAQDEKQGYSGKEEPSGAKMARTDLITIARDAQELVNMFGDDRELDDWVEAKITKAADYLNSVKKYLGGEIVRQHGGLMEENEQLNEDYQTQQRIADMATNVIRDSEEFQRLIPGPRTQMQFLDLIHGTITTRLRQFQKEEEQYSDDDYLTEQDNRILQMDQSTQEGVAFKLATAATSAMMKARDPESVHPTLMDYFFDDREDKVGFLDEFHVEIQRELNDRANYERDFQKNRPTQPGLGLEEGTEKYYHIIDATYDDGTSVEEDIEFWDDVIVEAEYRGRKVKLNKPMRGDVKKSKVYVKNAKGNVVKVNFGDKKMRIKKSNPKNRKSFRARHNCKNPGPKWKARYWSCKAW